MAEQLVVRPMREDDIPAVEQTTDESFYALSLREQLPGRPTPTRRSSAGSARWQQRMRHIRVHDPDGCWVAEDDAGVAGVAAALRRETAWLLSTFAVLPRAQGHGIGSQLLQAALTYAEGCLRGMIVASADPGALRRYRLAGFTMHPAMTMVGAVPREALPVPDRVREGDRADLDLLDSVDRRVRDAAHGVDHALLVQMYRLVVVDRSTGSGYAYVDHGGGPYLLAATNRRTATDLLWETLAATSPDTPVAVGHITAEQQWALDVGLRCRLSVRGEGYLALRGMRPPSPYLPSGAFL